MIFKIDALRTCAGLVCVSFFAALGGCGSDSSASTTSSNAPASSTAAGSTAPGSTAAAPTSSGTAPSTASAGKTASSSTSTTAAVPATAAKPASTLVTSSNNGDACLPSTMPSADTLFSSTKKVFAHYFYPFPLSIDNREPDVDYYNTQYLAVDGESGKWVAKGGYLRQRPLGTTPSLLSNWQQLNMEAEIREAIARGITGFTYDSMSVADATDSTSPLHMLLAAAQAVDSRFKIVVMPDLTALGSDSAAVVQIIAAVANSPAAYRLSDGSLVVTAFDAGLNSAAWWKSVLNTLSAKDIKVAFVPTFLGWNQYAAAFAPISYGFGDWGTATATAGTGMQSTPATVHSTYGKIFMMPVDPQQFRPQDFLYWEAGNSGAFRNAWGSAIQGDADWVQLVTWSDFSESSEVQPYTDATLNPSIGTGYYDLNGYYAAWFSTGQQPTITHDVLYYFYRREPTTAAASAQSKMDTANTAGSNNIELLAFLTAPGELTITIGGNTHTQNAKAGVTSFTIPTQPGVPQFALSRNGAQVFAFKGGVQIYGMSGIPSQIQDLTYWSGSASATGNCAL
jgi:Glycosyl hydrolase family 71